MMRKICKWLGCLFFGDHEFEHWVTSRDHNSAWSTKIHHRVCKTCGYCESRTDSPLYETLTDWKPCVGWKPPTQETVGAEL